MRTTCGKNICGGHSDDKSHELYPAALLTHILTHNRKKWYGNNGANRLKRNFIPRKKRPREPETTPWTLWIHFVISRSCVRVTLPAPKSAPKSTDFGALFIGAAHAALAVLPDPVPGQAILFDAAPCFHPSARCIVASCVSFASGCAESSLAPLLLFPRAPGQCVYKIMSTSPWRTTPRVFHCGKIFCCTAICESAGRTRMPLEGKHCFYSTRSFSRISSRTTPESPSPGFFLVIQTISAWASGNGTGQ